MSWQSTAEYYRILNELAAERVGGHASAPVTVWSVDFAEIEALQRAGDWDAQGRILNHAARQLAVSGADLIALGTNTLHLVADQITAELAVPFINLIDVVGESAAAAGYSQVGLLGTGYTMNSDLYPSGLAKYGVQVLVPEPEDRSEVHRVIYDELVHGVFTAESKRQYLDIVGRLTDAGAQAVVLGCTEIGLLITDGDATVPLLDTTRLHCETLISEMLKGDPS